MSDELVRELTVQPSAHAPSMGKLCRVKYTHTDMIDFIIANPTVTGEQLATRYGYTKGWISNVQASDAWKSAMAARREELVDPVLIASVNTRFEGLARLSLERLMEKLEKPMVSDQTVLKSVELAAKAMGIGGNAVAAPVQPAADHLAQLAERMLTLQANVRKELPYVEIAEAREVPVPSR